MCIREIKEDLLSEAELLIYQMKAAQLTKDYETVSDKAMSLTNICKKLDFIREEETRFIEETDF
jgi:hypothetical protein